MIDKRPPALMENPTYLPRMECINPKGQSLIRYTYQHKTACITNTPTHRQCVRTAPGAQPISMDSTEDIKLIKLLLERLERVSVDSYWAHRASGIRGGLLKQMEELEKGTPADPASTSELISFAFDILTRAAREKR